MTWTFNQSVFWTFGHILIPIACVMVDFLLYSALVFFGPSNEILLRESEMIGKGHMVQRAGCAKNYTEMNRLVSKRKEVVPI